jgi:hypothetical protein
LGTKRIKAAARPAASSSLKVDPIKAAQSIVDARKTEADLGLTDEDDGDEIAAASNVKASPRPRQSRRGAQQETTGSDFEAEIGITDETPQRESDTPRQAITTGEASGRVSFLVSKQARINTKPWQDDPSRRAGPLEVDSLTQRIGCPYVSDCTFPNFIHDSRDWEFLWTRWYFDARFVVDYFKQPTNEVTIEIREKHAALLEHNKAHPEAKIGYVPMWMSEEPDDETIALARKGEVFDLPAFTQQLEAFV